MGGNAGMISRLVGQQAPTPTPARPGAAYQAPAANIYSPTFQTPVQPIRGIGPQQYPQLQAALNNILARYGQTPANLQFVPMQQPRPMMPMPAYRAPALDYRPNMTPARESLGRVAISVAEQQRRAAQAELERLRAENETMQQRQQDPNYGVYGG